MIKPLDFCCNGDGRKIQPPSKVLCAECFAKLDQQIKTRSAKIKKLAEGLGYKPELVK